MIDEQETHLQFGYYSEGLTHGSTKKIIAICSECGRTCVMQYYAYRKTSGRCKSCANTGKNHPMYGKHHTEESKEKISRGVSNLSEETRKKISIANSGKNNPMFGNHHSEEIRNKMSTNHANFKGENHPRWNSNLTNEERINKRKIPENREWSLNIKKRDNFTCQKCNLHGGNLVSHHILGYSIHPDSRYDLDNGITLCENCHKQFHHLYGYKYFTDNDFFTWVISDE